MCGVFGTTRKISDALLQQITGQLNHRGPDSCGKMMVSGGTKRPESLVFLHTRLAIQDLTPGGHQPMKSRDNRWWITYNGEIYNHLNLREHLGSEFKSTSDTETLVEYIAANGIDKALKNLNGMYAFAAYDRQEECLYIARDPFGIKPLYYHVSHDGFTFSSELKPLLTCINKIPPLDLAALDCFLSLRYIPSPRTMLEGVNRLPPGHLLKFRLAGGEQSLSSFIQPNVQSFDGSFEDAVSAYHMQFSQAVKRQLLADVPVGVLLSGGIDSAVVAALAREHSSELSAHTVGFGDSFAECEITDAQETAKILGIEHDYVTIKPEGLVDSLTNIVSSVEEPLGTTSIIPMWYLTKKAREKSTVVLSGQGSDEPWGGYRRYQIELWLKMIPLLKNSVFRVPDSIVNLLRGDAVRRGVGCLGYPNSVDRFERAYALFTSNERLALGVPSLDYGSQSVEYWIGLLTKELKVSDADRMMRIDARMNLADDLLLYSDKISMNCALEARVPMLDPSLVQFIESLPMSFRSTLRRTKIVHKAMATNYLPKRIIDRPKKGFMVPFGTWSRTIWKDFIVANLLDSRLTIYSHLNRTAVQNLWQMHIEGKRDCSRQIFALLTLSLWMQEYA